MSAAQVERDAHIALVAFYRAWATEGLCVLSAFELADRIGYKAPKQISADVLGFLIEQRWVTQLTDAVEITDAGRNAALDILDQRQK